MKYLLALLAGTVLALATNGQEPPKWQEFTSKAGKYKITMPAAAKEFSTLDQGITLHGRAWTDKNETYMVLFGDFPDDIAKKSPEMIQEILEAGRDNTTRTGEGKLIRSKKIKLAGKHEGIDAEASITKPLKGLVRMRGYMVGSRLYTIMVAGPEDFVNRPETQRFLDSFGLSD